MKRQLTARELILLGMLLVLVLVGGYVMLYYMPMTAELERLEQEKLSCEDQLAVAQIQVEDKRRMEQELEEIFAANPNPLSIAPYDNLQPVMFELNTILSGAEDYSLSFGTVDTSQSIVRRSISLSFTSRSYESARDILGQLCSSAYRCLLDSVNISVGQSAEGNVSVDGVVLYFEYQRSAS